MRVFSERDEFFMHDVPRVNDGSTYVGFFHSREQSKSAAVIFYLNSYPLKEISRRDRA